LLYAVIAIGVEFTNVYMIYIHLRVIIRHERNTLNINKMLEPLQLQLAYQNIAPDAEQEHELS